MKAKWKYLSMVKHSRPMSSGLAHGVVEEISTKQRPPGPSGLFSGSHGWSMPGKAGGGGLGRSSDGSLSSRLRFSIGGGGGSVLSSMYHPAGQLRLLDDAIYSGTGTSGGDGDDVVGDTVGGPVAGSRLG